MQIVLKELKQKWEGVTGKTELENQLLDVYLNESGISIYGKDRFDSKKVSHITIKKEGLIKLAELILVYFNSSNIERDK